MIRVVFRNKNRQDSFLYGFTLVELTIVLGIALIILITSLVSLRFLTKYDLDNQAEILAGDLQKARFFAYHNHTNYTVAFDIANNSYRMFNATQEIINRTLTVSMRTVSNDTIMFLSPWGQANISGFVNLTQAGRFIIVNFSRTGFTNILPAQHCLNVLDCP
ncbi:MAG: hypothetical protein N2606_04060 [Candidatus Omnitrophica bacterium]|nr:hypothetical protein [Candidatus Omnitrophota bacterium]